MVELGDEKVIYAFGADAEPVLTVSSGETVRIRTKDCFGNQVRTAADVLDEIDWDRINPATGPIFVEGAQPGGALKVQIDAIELDARACAGIASMPGPRSSAPSRAIDWCGMRGSPFRWRP